jgi:hypothetical protein
MTEYVFYIQEGSEFFITTTHKFYPDQGDTFRLSTRFSNFKLHPILACRY